MNIFNIILALIVFSLIIIFHEFGHFIIARLNKVDVIEFSLGMGPRIVSYAKGEKKWKLLFFKSNKFFEENKEYSQNTIYSWKILPLGGSCMMLGEEEAVEHENSFSSKTVWQRMAIVFAGPLFNFILAFFLALIVIISTGYNRAEINTFTENSALEKAGAQVGDVIKKINDKDIVVTGELQYYLMFNKLNDSEVSILLDRNGSEIPLRVKPTVKEGEKTSDGNPVYHMGFTYGKKTKVDALSTIGYSFYEVKYWIATTLESLYHMIRGEVSPKDISGPVGIVQTVSNTIDKSASSGKDVAESTQLVTINLMIISILLTANLGVMNLLPIPALDGGRLFLYIIEVIRRKPIPEKVEGYVNMTGFALLMILMVFIFGNDIFKIIQG